jgi:hypothetical protein
MDYAFGAIARGNALSDLVRGSRRFCAPFRGGSVHTTCDGDPELQPGTDGVRAGPCDSTGLRPVRTQVRLVLPAVLLAALISACTKPASRDARLDYGSVGDVRAVLESGGATSLQLDCTNVGYPTGEVIRSVACSATLPPSTLATLGSTLALKPGPAFHEGMRDACESRAGLRSADAGVEVLVGTNARVPNGIGRIEIHVVRASGAACIEMTYPWSE